MGAVTRWMDAKLFPDQGSHWDDWLFRERILEVVGRDSVVLDLGAGAGIVESMNFRGIVAKVCGVDLDSRVTGNPYLDEGRLADAGRIPYPDATFDAVFSDNVLEHLADPVSVFREVQRVLKPGGRFLFKTPNKWHYMPVIARLTPHGFHRFINRLRGRAEVDTFPTLYRANSAADVRTVAGVTGFEIEALELFEGRPEYLRMAWPLYLVGAAYERIVNAWDGFRHLRVVMIGKLVKATDCSTG